MQESIVSGTLPPDIPLWHHLRQELQADLANRLGNDSEGIWDNQLTSDKRQGLLNTRAQLIALSVWEWVTSMGFARFEITRALDKQGRAVGRRVLSSFQIDNEAGWELAIVTAADVRPSLEALGFFRQSLRHGEARWQLKQRRQPGTDIVFHVLGIKAPYEHYTVTHFDAGGGGLSLRHMLDYFRGTGVTQNEVTRGLGKNSRAAEHLRGISKSLDDLLL